MTSTAEIIAAIDAFMEAPKRIIGYDAAPAWALGFSPHELYATYPLEAGGELRGQLRVVGFPNERVLKFRLGILLSGMICRLDYTEETHVNSLPSVMRGIVPATVTGPHYHSWPINRHLFKGVTKPPELDDALPDVGGWRSFDSALRWFCTDTHIEQPPSMHYIGLPDREILV